MLIGKVRRIIPTVPTSPNEALGWLYSRRRGSVDWPFEVQNRETIERVPSAVTFYACYVGVGITAVVRSLRGEECNTDPVGVLDYLSGAISFDCSRQ